MGDDSAGGRAGKVGRRGSRVSGSGHLGRTEALVTWGLLCAATACNAELLGGRAISGEGGAPGSAAGASGISGSPGSLDSGSEEERPALAPTTFACDPDARGQSPPLLRLTRTQYENTLRDLLAQTLGDTSRADALMVGLSTELTRLDPDVRPKVPEDAHGTYRRLDQNVQQAHVDAWYAIGRRAGELLSQPEHLGLLLGACAEDPPDDAAARSCVEAFVTSFGKWALRRPLSEEETALYMGFYEPSTGIDPAGVADVVTGLLNAPQFLYLVRHGQAETEAESFQLSPHELASRLSYHFWNSMPDAELMALADSGDLVEPDVYTAQVERLWAHARTRATVADFFLEWLKLEDLPQLDRLSETIAYQSFAGENLPSSELRQAMIDEVLELLDYYTWSSPGPLSEVFLSPHSFATSEELAELYGVEPWTGAGSPPTMPGERPGLLTRAAFLATGTANTRPIMKGVFIRANVLCDQIPPPPENANVVPPELSPELTTREVVEALTEGAGNTGCSGCHQHLINPLGFATEGFDSLGRARSEQQLFDPLGELLGTRTIDTRTVPQVIVGDKTEVDGPRELMEILVSSGKLEACFARHYFRFTFGRFEGVHTDGCVLEELRSALEGSGTVQDMLRRVALSDAFQQRTFVQSSSNASPENEP